jgi:hypothetical protein
MTTYWLACRRTKLSLVAAARDAASSKWWPYAERGGRHRNPVRVSAASSVAHDSTPCKAVPRADRVTTWMCPMRTCKDCGELMSDLVEIAGDARSRG